MKLIIVIIILILCSIGKGDLDFNIHVRDSFKEWIDYAKKRLRQKSICIRFETKKYHDYKGPSNFGCLFLENIKQQFISNSTKREKFKNWILKNFKSLERSKFEWFCPVEDEKRFYLNIHFDPGIFKRSALFVKRIFRLVKIRNDYCY